MKTKKQLIAEMATRLQKELNDNWGTYTNKAGWEYFVGNDNLSRMRDFSCTDTKSFIRDVVNSVLEEMK